MENLRIYVATWNVATSTPTEDLNGLLDFPSMNKHRPLPDFYVLGFQEVNSQPQNFLKDSIFRNPWTTSITTILKKSNYVRVKEIRLQGMLLLVFTLRNHLFHLRDIQTQYTRTGLGGAWGNKGAVSIRLTIYGCSICFVNSHLAAHEEKLEDRITDYNTIIKQHTYSVKDTVNILYHDYVFWLGDLNFRVSEDCPDLPLNIADKVTRAEKDDYTELLKYDQLKMVMEKELAFSELKETPPKFPPTYKFTTGTNEYDLKRKPSWTDRILHKVIPNTYENITLKADQLNYHSLPQYTLSDHKPVVAEFQIKIRVKQSIVVSRGMCTDSSNYSFFSDGVLEDKIVFSHYTERCIEFLPIKDVWYFGDADILIKFSLSGDTQIHPTDWIGLFEFDFENLDDYISYEYMGKINSFIPSVDDSARIVVFSFPVGSGVKSPGFYKFLYFSQPSSEVRSLLGISECFEVRNSLEDSIGSLSLNSQYDIQTPSTSSDPGTSSAPQPNPSMLNSLMKDIGNLHVPGMKFDKIHDLSID